LEQPAAPLVERDIKGVFGPQKEQPFADGILRHTMGIAEHAFRDTGCDGRPGFSVIGGLIDVRIAVIDLVEVNGYVCPPGVIAGRLDLGHIPPWRQAGNGLGDIVPMAASVPGDMDKAIIRPGPDDIPVEGRLGDGEERAVKLDTRVVRGQAAGRLLFALVVGRQVGADHSPGLARVFRNMHILASSVYPPRMVGRKRDRERPLEAELLVGQGPIPAASGPGIHVPCQAGPQVRVLRYPARPKSKPWGSTGPDR
jgi:hypothetical protein